ncbi:class I SAM-dependent methyltransferase [Streptomyces sp. NPDC090306]|uniref:class I SAM-dependent methyltransferase n=1 Tax=unclassified Streptomyces TaxID=2593676 RepID=UPI0036E85D8A
MSVTARYRQAWEEFWREAPREPGAVFWDAEPALTAGVHVAHFEPLLPDASLPMVDLGCGSGTQTGFLAERFPRVVGVDLAAAAVARARRADPGGRADYRVLDASDKTAAQALRAELGDCNVYVRGVLHHCDPDDRQQLVDTLAVLAGDRGRAFLVEPTGAAGPLLRRLAQDGTAPKLDRVLRHGITPDGVPDEAVRRHLLSAGLRILAAGELPMTTTELTDSGTRVVLPSKWVVAGRAG